MSEFKSGSNAIDIQRTAAGIVGKLNEAGYTAYFAGGWVRDHLMGHSSDDIDIATNAPPKKIIALFPRTILVGLAFGIVIVVADGHHFEVATFRKDINYLDGRKPSQIELSTAEEDAARRDFTINGMFYDPLGQIVYDFVQGAEDIKKRVIRTIGSPGERFVEDRLRMLRAVRFATRFGFSIDPETQAAIAANADTLFPAVALERVWQEFTKMSKYLCFDTALIEMHRLKLLPVIFPALKGFHPDKIKEAVSGFKFFPKNAETILYVMELFPAITLNEGKELCRYLRISNREARLAEFLILMRQHVERERTTAAVDLDAWAHLYVDCAAVHCLQVVAAKMPIEERTPFLLKHQERMNLLKKHIERIRSNKPLVTALQLQHEGILPGRLMGILLKEGERLAILNDLNDTVTVLAMLKMSPAWPKKGEI